MKAYGDKQLTDSSPAQTFTEVLALADAKSYLRVTSTSQDSTILRMITGARAVAEGLRQVDLVPKQKDLHLDLLLGYDGIAGAAYPSRSNHYFNLGIGYEIELDYPLRSVDLFQYTDSNGNVTQLVEGRTADYQVDLNRGLVLPPWGKLWPFFTPDVSSAVLIRFTSGYSATHPFWSNDGSMVIQGMMLLVSAWWENRLPFNPDMRGVVGELPWGITDLLMWHARPRVY